MKSADEIRVERARTELRLSLIGSILPIGFVSWFVAAGVEAAFFPHGRHDFLIASIFAGLMTLAYLAGRWSGYRDGWRSDTRPPS